jgi:hypothetical protein
MFAFSYGLGEVRNGNRTIAAIRIVRFGGTPTAARVGASPASELNCNRMKVQNYATRNEELHGAGD